MSNSLFMDESNGNGLFASKSNNPSSTASTNNISNMTAANTTPQAAMATLHTSVSNEDLSQSLSEYTDADESISAPTEFLAEFLSAVMLKDYKKAFKYCKLILQYEPNNATANEFYPLIQEKLKEEASSDSDENYNKSSSPEMVLDQPSDPSGESDEASSDGNHHQQQDCDDYGENSSGENISSRRSSSRCSGLAGESISDSEDVISSGDDLLMDDNNMCDASASGGAGIESNSSRNSSNGGDSRSRSDNTTHSYSSLLLEEEDDIVPTSLHFNKNLSSPDLDVSNGNKIHSTSCSDSESPTEPLTQRLAAILRSKCGVNGDQY